MKRYTLYLGMKKKQINKIVNIILLVGGSSLFSCIEGNNPDELESAMHLAGSNRVELERVLNHYESDSLKRRAAVFLIKNMSYHSYLDGEDLDKAYRLYQSCSGRKKDEINSIVDSCTNADGAFVMDKLQRKYDIQTIDSALLVHHIDETFRAWHEYPWGKNVSFEELCEYVLPYRLGDEVPTKWRTSIMEEWKPFTDSISHTSNAEDPFYVACQVFKVLSDRIANFTLHIPPTPHPGPNIVKWNVGACREKADIVQYVFRALCLPCAADFIVSGDYNTGHTWNSIKDKSGQAWWVDLGSGEMRPSYKYLDVKGKAFRTTFSKNENTGRLYFDVTADYAGKQLMRKLTVGASEVHGIFKNGEQYALCIPMRTSWVAVDWATAQGGKLCYGDFKAGTVACICKKEEAKMLPCSLPFRTELESGHQRLRPFAISGKNETVTLLSKFPPIDEPYLERMVGGVFEGSNIATFSHADTLAVIEDVPNRLVNIIKSRNHNMKYRYIRYRGAKDSHCNTSEIAFYEFATDTIPLAGEIIGYPEPTGDEPSRDYRRALDGDPYTSFDCESPSDGWVGLDLGKPMNINKVAYTPRNRDNFIRKGDLYELLWWDKDHWTSAGKKEATTDEISFIVPEGALLYLRDLTRGEQERVFEYQSGRQIWW